MSEERKPLWALTLTVNEDGSRGIDVDGTPSLAEMMAELNMMTENLRAELFVQKLKEQGRKPQIHKP